MLTLSKLPTTGRKKKSFQKLRLIEHHFPTWSSFFRFSFHKISSNSFSFLFVKKQKILNNANTNIFLKLNSWKALLQHTFFQNISHWILMNVRSSFANSRVFLSTINYKCTANSLSTLSIRQDSICKSDLNFPLKNGFHFTSLEVLFNIQINYTKKVIFSCFSLIEYLNFMLIKNWFGINQITCKQTFFLPHNLSGEFYLWLSFQIDFTAHDFSRD